MKPYDDTSGDVGSWGNGNKGVNQGQIRAVVEIYASAARFHCIVLTASEYYVESGFLCYPGAAATGLTASPAAVAVANIFTLATYGSVWNGYCYEAAEATVGQTIVQ